VATYVLLIERVAGKSEMGCEGSRSEGEIMLWKPWVRQSFTVEVKPKRSGACNARPILMKH
jgi:hypothetical protein